MLLADKRSVQSYLFIDSHCLGIGRKPAVSVAGGIILSNYSGKVFVISPVMPIASLSLAGLTCKCSIPGKISRPRICTEAGKTASSTVCFSELMSHKCFFFLISVLNIWLLCI